MSLTTSTRVIRHLLNSRHVASRAFSTTLPASRSLESPTYPGLFYHSLPSTPSSPSLPNTWSLSFLPDPPPSATFQPTIIGILRPRPGKDGQVEEEEGQPPAVLPRNFEENEMFEEVLHEILMGAVQGDVGLQTLAAVRGDGYIHIADERNPSDPNRVPDPSDILSSILIQKKKILPSSYSKSGTHRVVSMDGMMKLRPELMSELVKGLERVREVEVEVAKEEEGA